MLEFGEIFGGKYLRWKGIDGVLRVYLEENI